MKKNIIFSITIFCALLSFFPLAVFAVSELPAVALEAVPGSVGINNAVMIDIVLLPSLVGANAFETSLNFDSKKLKFIGSRLNDSVINLWIVSPTEEKEGSVYFAGIIPGGFSRGGVVAHLEFAPQEIGNTKLSLEDTHIGLQRTIGEVVNISGAGVEVIIDSGFGDMPRETVNPETPVVFSPSMVSQNEAIFSNQWFIPFVAKNKSADISQYFVQETSFWQPKADAWVPAKSPYILQDQSRGSYIFIKARDIVGREAVFIVHPQWFKQTKFWAAAASLVGGFLIIFALIVFRRRRI